MVLRFVSLAIPKGLVFNVNDKLPLLYEDILVVSKLADLSVGAYFGAETYSHDRYPFFRTGSDSILDDITGYR